MDKPGLLVKSISKQGSPPVWLQEAYRSWHILSIACCVWGRWGGMGGIPLSWSWLRGGDTHVLVLTRVPPPLPLPTARTRTGIPHRLLPLPPLPSTLLPLPLPPRWNLGPEIGLPHPSPVKGPGTTDHRPVGRVPLPLWTDIVKTLPYLVHGQ